MGPAQPVLRAAQCDLPAFPGDDGLGSARDDETLGGVVRAAYVGLGDVFVNECHKGSRYLKHPFFCHGRFLQTHAASTITSTAAATVTPTTITNKMPVIARPPVSGASGIAAIRGWL